MCFVALALVVLGGPVLPGSPGNDLEAVLQRVAVLVLLAFPCCLFRFAAAFRRPSRHVEWLVGGATALLMVWALALPDFPESGSQHSTFVDVYLIALLVDWTVLSVFVAGSLWRAGRGLSSVARHRMQMLSVAALLLTIAVLLAGGDPAGSSRVELATSALVPVSAFAFLLGLSPPSVARVIWRREEGERWREAIPNLVRASTPDEIVADVLPLLARLVGARAALFLDHEGRTLAAMGAPPAVLDTLDVPVGTGQAAPLRSA